MSACGVMPALATAASWSSKLLGKQLFGCMLCHLSFAVLLCFVFTARESSRPMGCIHSVFAAHKHAQHQEVAIAFVCSPLALARVFRLSPFFSFQPMRSCMVFLGRCSSFPGFPFFVVALFVSSVSSPFLISSYFSFPFLIGPFPLLRAFSIPIFIFLCLVGLDGFFFCYCPCSFL